MSEREKKALLTVDSLRSEDAFKGVNISPTQHISESITVGPYTVEGLTSVQVRSFLSGSDIAIVACGKNEHRLGNLIPVLRYAQESSGGNVLYFDGGSTDSSCNAAQSLGIPVFRRQEIISPDYLDTGILAEILNINPKTLEGHSSNEDPPLQKGLDTLAARIILLQRQSQGKTKRYVGFLDTDLKSIPGGSMASSLGAEQIYYPLEILAAGIIELGGTIGLFTGSDDRNNETLFAVYNNFCIDATSPYCSDKQHRIAYAFYFFPSLIVHPATGELVTSVETELSLIGSTGMGVDVARHLSIAGLLMTTIGIPGSQEIRYPQPSIGNVRRGQQLRIDELQTPEKEWWMLTAALPQFIRTFGTYCIAAEKFPQELTIDDYLQINRWLSQINEGSQLTSGIQGKAFYQFPMERVIPPVTLLQYAGVLKKP